MRTNGAYARAANVLLDLWREAVSLTSEAILGEAVPALASCQTYFCTYVYGICSSCGADKKTRRARYCQLYCVGACCEEPAGCVYC